MYKTVESKNQLSIDFASKPHYLGKTIDIVQQFLRDKLNGSEYGYHSILVVCHELLKNALFHGNCQNEHKAVHITVRQIDDELFRITVKDEGPGFNFNMINPCLPDDPKHLRQKGYVLISTLARNIGFNEEGNRITVDIEVDKDK